MARVLELLIYLLIPSLILIHLFVAPYSKVEESFNLQATHDILVHGIPTQNAAQFLDANYDHVSFPGSVPRTFLGALMLAGMARPWVGWVADASRVQLLVRAVLGLLNASALVSLAFAVQKAFGRTAGIWYALFQASQFHVIFYASRTLPNMFAFIFNTIALRSLLLASTSPTSQSRTKLHRLSLYLLTFAGVVFRSELAILVGTTTLYILLTQRISIPHTIIPAGLGGLLIGLLCTIPIDSFFWQSFPLWPEWVAFKFNTIDGHSAAWGVSPWYFYFLNALPRLMINPLTYLLCIPLAVSNPATRRRSLDVLVPVLSFVALYSFLPHKEWRFIIYAIPGVTGVAAAGASWIWTRRSKSPLYCLLSLTLVLSIILSFLISSALLIISSLNYPGGTALSLLHSLAPPGHPAHPYRVYLDNLACQTGVTRFLQNHEGPQTITDILDAESPIAQRAWVYDKTEDPEALLTPAFWDRFDYVLAEAPERVIGKWDVVAVVYGFGGVRVLRPGIRSVGAGDEIVEQGEVWKKDGMGRGRFTEKTAETWRMLERLLRERVCRGWWVEVRMEPKIRILATPKLREGGESR